MLKRLATILHIHSKARRSLLLCICKIPQLTTVFLFTVRYFLVALNSSLKNWAKIAILCAEKEYNIVIANIIGKYKLTNNSLKSSVYLRILWSLICDLLKITELYVLVRTYDHWKWASIKALSVIDIKILHYLENPPFLELYSKIYKVISSNFSLIIYKSHICVLYSAFHQFLLTDDKCRH